MLSHFSLTGRVAVITGAEGFWGAGRVFAGNLMGNDHVFSAACRGTLPL